MRRYRVTLYGKGGFHDVVVDADGYDVAEDRTMTFKRDGSTIAEIFQDWGDTGIRVVAFVDVTPAA